MRRLFTIASTPFRAIIIISAIWLGIGWLTGYLSPLDASLELELPAWVQVPGVVAVVAGGALVLLCGVRLSTSGVGTLSGSEWFLPREFVATGPFQFVRNPMSLGAVVLMTGIALCHRSALGLGLAAALFLVFHLVIVRVEERGLEKRFGDGYRDYRRNVRRWVPRLKPWQRSTAQLGPAPDGSPPAPLGDRGTRGDRPR